MDLINTLETPGEFDALTSLRPDEPYFLLVGRDRLAPALVQKWADDNRVRALKEFSDGKIDEEKRDRELRKSTQAEAIGWAMTAFKAGHMAKEAVEEKRPTYSGHELPEATKRSDKMQSLRLRAVVALNGAAGEVWELLQFILSFDDFGELEPLAAGLQVLVEDIRAASALVTPKRPI